jgi:hypothetical protein
VAATWHHVDVIALGLSVVFAAGATAVARWPGWFIEHLTSRSLGTLAPGYAGTDSGLRVYAWVLTAIALLLNSIWFLGVSVVGGLAVFAVGAVLFVVSSVIVIRGEVTTFRALKR